MPLPYERLHDGFSTTLTAAITTTTQSSISVATAAPGWVPSGPFRVRIDSEVMLVTGGASTTTWSPVVRGASGTTRATHSNGATITHLVTDVGLGAVIEQQRPNVPNLARFNQWGAKFRGVTPSVGTANPNGYYAKYWGSLYNSTLIAQQFSQAVSLGANHIKIGGSPYEVIDGTTSQATHLAHIEAWLDMAWNNGLFVSFNITDNLSSPDTATRATLAQEITQGMALATLLDQYPNVVAIDVINEVNGWQVQRGGTGSYSASQPDATSVAWIAGPDSLTAAIRSVTSKPIGYSLYAQSAAQLLANTGSDWLPLLVANCDYLDLHPYWPAGTDMALSDLQALHVLYPQLAVYFGELSVAFYSANTPEVRARIEAARSWVEQSYVPGLNIYTLDDYGPLGGTGTGIFDQSGNERPNMSYPFRTLPRRAGYAGPQTIPLVTPADPFPLGTTSAPVPSAKFPLKTSYYATTLGDPNYRVFAVVGEGILTSDVIELVVYDLDTSLTLGSVSSTVSSTGGPTVADSSSYNNVGSVIGGATTATGKFSNGVQITTTAHQIQWPNFWQPIGTAPWTVECWIKKGRLATQEAILDQWKDGGAAVDASWFLFTATDNKLGFWWIDGSNSFNSIGTTATITDTTTFHHVALSYDGTTLRLYLDGVLGGSQATTFQAAPTSQLIVASGHPNTTTVDAFQGIIDEVRFSDIARYTTTPFTPSASAFTTDANTLLLAHMDSVAAASTNITSTLATEWQYVQPLSAVNAGVKFRNTTAARGAVLSASLEVRYA